MACNNGNLVVISEALDSIFDMFKEDHTDVVVREIGLVEKLKSVQSSFKTKVNMGERQKIIGERLRRPPQDTTCGLGGRESNLKCDGVNSL